MNQDSLILKLVAERIEQQKLEEAEKRKSYSWLGSNSFIFIDHFFSPWKAKKSQREHEAILNKYLNQTEPKPTLPCG